MPKFISFDCYGTLTNFDIGGITRTLFADQVDTADMPEFLADYGHYRRDEVLGDWKPYQAILADSLERTCRKHGVSYDPELARAIYEKIPEWGPHPDVTEGLKKLEGRIPLVILSNSMRDLIMHNVNRLGVRFDHVLTAEDARAYKPRLQAFEFMLDHLGCAPQDVMHVSCHYRYDLMPTCDLGFGRRVFVDRGAEIVAHGYETDIIPDVRGLADLIGV